MKLYMKGVLAVLGAVLLCLTIKEAFATSIPRITKKEEAETLLVAAFEDMKAGNFRKALDLALVVYDYNPNFVVHKEGEFLLHSCASVADAYYQLGEMQNAIRYYEETLKYVPDADAAFARLARARAKLAAEGTPVSYPMLTLNGNYWATGDAQHPQISLEAVAAVNAPDFAEHLKANLLWDPAQETAILLDGPNYILLKPGDTQAIKNGEPFRFPLRRILPKE